MAAAECDFPNHMHRCEKQTLAQKYALPTAGEDYACRLLHVSDINQMSPCDLSGDLHQNYYEFHVILQKCQTTVQTSGILLKS